MAETKLILALDEAKNYVQYLTGFTSTMTYNGDIYLGLGNITGSTFTEITPTAANNYARVLVKRIGDDKFPNLIKVNAQKPREVYNHEQIVFNKVLTAAYNANAIGLYRIVTNTSGTVTSAVLYAYGMLENPLDAVVGSVPMFEREKLKLTIPDGTETD